MTQNLSLDGRFERVSKPRYWWWGSIQAALRAYPRLKQRYEMPDVALTARYAEGVGHDSTPGRTTETAALERLCDGDYKIYLAITEAVKETEQMTNGRDRLRLIELLYWKRYWKTIEGAAYEVGYSTQRAKEIHGEFIRLVAYHRRLIPRENVHKKRMSYQTAKKV